MTSASIGQGVYCEDTCEIRQYSPDGDAVSGDTYRVQVDILPILNPCDGCTITCDGDYSIYSAGCSANPGENNCLTLRIDPVDSDISGSCSASGDANKIRVRLTAHDGIKCGDSCDVQFAIDNSYLMMMRNPGNTVDDWLSTGTTISLSFDADQFTSSSYTMEIMAVLDEFSVL